MRHYLNTKAGAISRIERIIDFRSEPMKTIVSIAVAGMIAATSLTAAVAPASAGSFSLSIHQHSGGYHHGGYHRKKYHRHRHRHHHSGAGAAIAAGALLGLAFGALATPTYHYPAPAYAYPRVRPHHPHRPYALGHHANAQHVSWCHSRYKSYNASNNTWFGYDGLYHQCVSPY